MGNARGWRQLRSGGHGFDGRAPAADLSRRRDGDGDPDRRAQNHGNRHSRRKQEFVGNERRKLLSWGLFRTIDCCNILRCDNPDGMCSVAVLACSFFVHITLLFFAYLPKPIGVG